MDHFILGGGIGQLPKKFLHSKSREKKIVQSERASKRASSQAKGEKKILHKLKTEKKIRAQKNCPTPTTQKKQ